MGKTLFIGCSHSMGYVDYNINTPCNIWQENNYAEIYSKLFNKDVIIMASAGCGNRAYPNFLAHALKEHDDIEEVYIQSTYWGRFPIAINPDLNEKSIFPLDFFIEKDFASKRLTRYSIGLVQRDRYLEQYLKVESEHLDSFPYLVDTTPVLQPDIRHSPYIYVQMWHYNQTHLEQQDYIKDITLCDLLCRTKNIPLTVWNINDRCFIPKEVDGYYTSLTNTKFADIDAISFLGKHLEKDKIDSEHYSYNVHEKIAKEYIPYLKETL